MVSCRMTFTSLLVMHSWLVQLIRLSWLVQTEMGTAWRCELKSLAQFSKAEVPRTSASEPISNHTPTPNNLCTELHEGPACKGQHAHAPIGGMTCTRYKCNHATLRHTCSGLTHVQEWRVIEAIKHPCLSWVSTPGCCLLLHACAHRRYCFC